MEVQMRMKQYVFLVFFFVFTLILILDLQGVQELNIYAEIYDIKADNANRVHIIWRQNNTWFYGQIEGNAVVNQETIPVSGVITSGFRPRIAVNPDGSRVHFVWKDRRFDARTIYHCWRDTNGNWHQETSYTAPYNNYVAFPSVGVDGAGVVHLVAAIYNRVNTFMSIIYLRKSGSSWQTQSNLAPSNAKHTHTNMFVDHNGGVHVIWSVDADFLQYRYTPSGGNLSSSSTYTLPSSSYRTEHGDVFVDRKNNVHVVALSFGTPATTQNIVESWIKPGGSSSFSSPTNASVNHFNVFWHYITYPVVAAASTDQVVTSWAVETSQGKVNQVWASAKIDGVWNPYLLDNNALLVEESKPALAVNDYTAFLIWRGANGKLKMETYTYGSVTPTITVTSPNGGELWEVNSTHNFTWSSTGTVGNVKIEYSTDNGTTWKNVVSSTANDESYSWKVPNTISSQCLVKIKEASDGDPSDTSDSTFSIVPANSLTELSLSRTQFTFGYVQGGATPQSQSFIVSNTGNGTSNWSVSPSSSWMNCDPTSGIDSGEVTVSMNPSGLTAGDYNGTITVSDPNATNSPQVVSVALSVYSPGGSSTPFGMFETPTDGSTVSGSIPVTGWVLDDVGVESVNIFRKEGGAYVYIGGALFVKGARPDVEQAYPDFPMNYQAGWGYMMLTNFLPNGGNGTVTLYAIAKDIDGHQITLGTKTINCDNANAVKPFGAIDTPRQGGDASGSSYRNNGWVLTPIPNSIPTNGSTISVIVDGVDLGHPTYNIFRSDISELFPGYSNSEGAAAYFDIDTTAYANGVHTIAWTATDNANNSDGIGSRYFSIQNLAESRSQSAAHKSNPEWLPNPLEIPIDFTGPVGIIKEHRKDIEPQQIYPNARGIINVEIKELERIEIGLFPGNMWAPLSMRWAGYQLVGSQLRPLPIGSTLDIDKGVFYWLPGPGFFGKYRLIFFVESDTDILRKEIQLTITSKFDKK
jgi:hypothetical protein